MIALLQTLLQGLHGGSFLSDSKGDNLRLLPMPSVKCVSHAIKLTHPGQ